MLSVPQLLPICYHCTTSTITASVRRPSPPPPNVVLSLLVDVYEVLLPYCLLYYYILPCARCKSENDKNGWEKKKITAANREEV